MVINILMGIVQAWQKSAILDSEWVDVYIAFQVITVTWIYVGCFRNAVLKNISICYIRCTLESDVGQKDVGSLSDSVLRYLKDLPSPLIPACIYPQLQTAVTLQQQVLQQSAGRSLLMSFMLPLD